MENNEVKITPQEEIGAILRKIREENNWTTKEVSQQFHITEYSLEKIETGKKDKSKSSYYSRLYIIRFLKRVNQYNETNKELLERAYPNSASDTMKDAPSLNYSVGVDKPHNIEAKRGKKKNKSRFLNAIAFLLILAIIFVSAYYTIQVLQSRTEKANENPTTLIENTTLKPEETIKAKVVEKKETKAKIETGKIENRQLTYTIKTLADKDNYKLKLDFKGDSYIEIRDGKTNESLTDSKVYKKGEKIEVTIKNTNDITLNLGYAKGVEMSIDGQKLDASDYPQDQIFVTIKNEA